MVRDIRVELISQVWKTHILTDIRIPRKLVAGFGIAPKLTSAYETDPALLLVDPRLKNLNSFNKHTTTVVRRQELNPNREHHYCS